MLRASQISVKSAPIVRFDGGDCLSETRPLTLFVSAEDCSAAGDLYCSLSLAISDSWFSHSVVYLLAGSHALRPGGVSTEAPAGKTVTVRTLFCSQLARAQCATEPARVQLGTNHQTIVVAYSLQIQDVIIEGNFPLKPSCEACIYCPATENGPDGLVDDRGNSVTSDSVAESALCLNFAASVLFDVRPDGALSLQSVQFTGIRHQLRAVILSTCGTIALRDVTVTNVMTAQEGAVLVLETEGSDPCGEVTYQRGVVELLNNGYELGADWGYSGFLQAENTASVVLEGVEFRSCFMASSLLLIEDSLAVKVSNCTFDTNIVDYALIHIRFSANFQESPTEIVVEGCEFNANFGFHTTGIILSSQSHSLDVTLKNCRFWDNFAVTNSIVNIQIAHMQQSRDLFSRTKPPLILDSRVLIEDLTLTHNAAPSMIVVQGVSAVHFITATFTSNGDIAFDSNSVLQRYISQPETYATLSPTAIPNPTCSDVMLLEGIGNVTIARSEFTAGRCGLGATGLHLIGNLENSQLVVSNTSFSGNSGGGVVVALVAVSCSVTDSLFRNNTNEADLNPACLLIEGSAVQSVFISGSLFLDNRATANTLLLARGIQSLELRNLRVERNRAEFCCAGFVFRPIATVSSSFAVSDSLFANNSAENSGVLTIINDTFQPGSATCYVNFSVLDSIFIGNSARYSGSAITLRGRIALSHTSRIARITSRENVCIEGGAALYAQFSLGTMTVTDSQFVSNSGRDGAALYHKSMEQTDTKAVLVVTASEFSDNSGDSVVFAEGLVHAELQTALLTFRANHCSCVAVNSCLWTDFQSTFLQNTAQVGAAVVSRSSVVDVEHVLFLDNVSEEKAGAVLVSAASNFTCNNCTFARNKSGIGGAVYVDQNSTCCGTNVTFLSNIATAYASCLFANNAYLSIDVSVIRNNRASLYGCFYLSSATLIIAHADVAENWATQRSPGFTVSAGTLIIVDSRCHDQVGVWGGCAFLSDHSTGLLVNMQIWNATASIGGALVAYALSDITFRNSAMTDCSAGINGGLVSISLSILRLYNVSIANVKSSLNYGAVFLSQSTLVASSMTFNDLTGSAIYCFSTNVTIENCTFQRINTKAGSGLNCVECANINISQSTFVDNLAKKGGALNSFTSGTALNALRSNLVNNTFLRNRAVNGGAIYFDSIFLTMTGNRFAENSASSEYYAAVEMTERGIGGAVFSVCSTLPFCELVYSDNDFANNSAEMSGGGLYWAGSFPTLSANRMTGNAAKYGADIASFPVRLAAVSDDQSLAPYVSIDARTGPVIAELDSVASGYVFADSVRVALVDHYDNIVRRDSASSAHFFAPNDSAASAAGNTEVVAVNGIFEFRNFTLKAPPGSIQSLQITSKGVDLTRKIYAHDPTAYYATVGLSISFRACRSGESLQNGECYPCPENTFSLHPSESCLTCPGEAVCYGTNIMVPKAGYWRPDPMRNLFFECMNRDACLGSPSTSQPSLTGECAAGYTGNLCTACETNYSSQGSGVCSRCPSLVSNVILLSALGLTVLCLFTLIVYISIRGATKQRSEIAIYFKILLNYLQIVTVAASLNLDWPNYVMMFLKGQEVAGNAAEQLLSVECLLKEVSTGEPFFSKVVVFVSIPAAMIVLILVFWAFASCITVTTNKLQKMITSFVLTIFVLHTTLTKVLFSVFTCRELLPGEFWLTSNLSIRCWDRTHMDKILTVVLPGILVWIVGLPTVCLLVIVRSRRALQQLSLKLMFSFLYKGYAAQWYFWEFVILYRKILVVCISVFLTTVSQSLQAITMLAVLLVSVYVQQVFHPFVAVNFNKLELRSLFASLLTLYGGLYFSSDSVSAEVDAIIFAAILAADAYFICYWAALVGAIIMETIRHSWASLVARRKVRPEPNEAEVSHVGKSSAQYADGTQELFEVPNNTSFVSRHPSLPDPRTR